MSKRPAKAGRRLASASTLVSSFLETADAVEARLEAAVSPMGLSLAKLALLHQLAEAKEPLPLSELAQLQNCVRSNITQQADQKGKRALTEEQQAIVKSLSTGEAASLTGVLELLGP